MSSYLKLIKKISINTRHEETTRKMKQKLFDVGDSWEVGVGQNMFVRTHLTVV